MKNKKTTRLVVMVTALGSMGLLAAMQGCSSSDDNNNPPTDNDSGASSTSSSSSSSSSSGGQDSGSDANKTDSGKTDAGDGGACYDNTRTTDGGADGGTVACPDAICADICTAIYKAFKADVADEVIKNLVPATDCQALDTDNQRKTLIAKVKTASAKSCVDIQATQFCGAVPMDVANKCRGNAEFDANCAAISKGLTGGGSFGPTDPETGRSIAYKCMHGDVDPEFANCNECLLAVASGQLFAPKN